jgi:hypothetical protein
MLRRTTSLLLTLTALLALAVPAEAGAAMRHATSANWAGYSVSGSGVKFHKVIGTWVQPAANCTAGERKYSAYWVGIGGAHSASNALEQIGTQVNCSALGQPYYSAWYELVPAGPVAIKLDVHPGDTLSAKVAVSGRTVKLYLANRTTGAVFVKQVRAKHLDQTSAEWIVEAPSTCVDASCQPLPLADFGSASFSGARAMSTTGRAGPIASPAWSARAIALSPAAAFAAGSMTAGSDGGATPSDLSAGGDAFTVTYQGPPAPPAPAPAPPAPAPPAPPAPAPPPPAPTAPVPPPFP